ncbi:MAG TPA: hypothetical protein DCS93_42455 [Microscillaceae bacterium]|nr:hypothetical protein [Microscillaceae bacterium]
MEQMNEIWEIYRSCWSERNSTKRVNQLSTIMSDDFQYKDPNIELIGFEQLSNYMQEFQNQFEGASFEITDFNVHHDSIMANWNMISSTQEVMVNGVDFARFERGKLKQITGFFKED